MRLSPFVWRNKGAGMATQVRFIRKHRMDTGKGTVTTFHPGDFDTFAPAVALKLVEQGIAEVLKPIELPPEATSGLLLVAPDNEALIKLTRLAPGAQGEVAALDDVPALLERFAYVVWWDGKVPPPTASRLAQGIEALRREWSIAVPVADYKVLAADIASSHDREMTAALIGDLRVPVLSPGLIFMRGESEAKPLIEAWLDEIADGVSDMRLGFLRALWLVKPHYLPLPATWAGVKVV